MELSKEILKYLNLDKKGFFVEAGANDGINQSNTYILEKSYGWSGILVEPSKTAYEACLVNRQNSKTYNFCLTSEEMDDSIIYGDFDGNLMSSVDGKRLNRKNTTPVKTITLQKLFDINNIKYVDFFSLDTEGYEFEVLKGIDFSRVFIEKMIIEIYEHNKQEIFDFLKKEGYKEPLGITNFNKVDNPFWDGTHNDYLFIKN
jgi:FkbM family methyltransferase